MLPTRPTLPPEESKRAEQQALRIRLLNGTWGDDLERALGKHISADRRTAWGIPEMSRNPFRALATQIGGALYQQPPTIGGDQALIKAVSDAGAWSILQRLSTDLVGVREALLRVDWSERGGLSYRPISPDLVVVKAVSESPDVPALVEELQVRTDPDSGKDAWCWEVLDIRDLANPVHKVVSADRTKDWTEAVFGAEKSGENYQYRDGTGKPYLPVVMYHAERTGRLWDAYYGIEAVLGSMTLGVLLTFWIHGVKDASFSTVLLVAGKLVGEVVSAKDGTETRTKVISMEPGSIAEIAPSEEGVQPSVHQMQPGFDPEKLMAAISSFEQGLAQYAGVSPADLLRTGADPRSGASLAISRDGLRQAQARFEPQLRRGDLELLAVSAMVLNGATGSTYAEAGYTIAYPSIPQSVEEARAVREELSTKIGLGLMSKVDAYIRLNPGTDRSTAIAELQRIGRENAALSTTII